LLVTAAFRSKRSAALAAQRAAMLFLPQPKRGTPYFRNKRRDAVFAENEPDWNPPFVSLYSFPPQ
jgi:hypothetical protein